MNEKETTVYPAPEAPTEAIRFSDALPTAGPSFLELTQGLQSATEQSVKDLGSFQYVDLGALFTTHSQKAKEAPTPGVSIEVLDLAILKFENILQSGKGLVENLTLAKELPWDIDFHIKAQNEATHYLGLLKELRQEARLRSMTETAPNTPKIEAQPPAQNRSRKSKGPTISESQLPEFPGTRDAAAYLGISLSKLRRELEKPNQGRLSFFIKEEPEGGFKSKQSTDRIPWQCYKAHLIEYAKTRFKPSEWK